MSRRSSGVISLPLQFREASQGADVKGNLLIEGAFCGVERKSYSRSSKRPGRSVPPCGESPSGGLATIDDGSQELTST
jgi:hypothetical protein